MKAELSKLTSEHSWFHVLKSLCQIFPSFLNNGKAVQQACFHKDVEPDSWKHGTKKVKCSFWFTLPVLTLPLLSSVTFLRWPAWRKSTFTTNIIHDKLFLQCSPSAIEFFLGVKRQATARAATVIKVHRGATSIIKPNFQGLICQQFQLHKAEIWHSSYQQRHSLCLSVYQKHNLNPVSCCWIGDLKSVACIFLFICLGLACSQYHIFLWGKHAQVCLSEGIRNASCYSHCSLFIHTVSRE